MTEIISNIEGTINTDVGNIKQNSDGRSLNKEGAEQEALGKRHLEDSSETDKPKSDD